MRAPLGVCFLALAVVVVGAQSPATDPPPQRPTFRGGINYVKVDMYASRDGVALTDLQRDDIELLEDGKPQTIKDFEHVKVVSGTPQDLRREPNTVDESRQMAADSRARVFVIFLDTLHTSVFGSANMRQPLIRFIDRLLGPDDLIAVMTPEMSAGDITFGRKTTVISKMLEREWAWGRRDRADLDDNKESLYTACYGTDIAKLMIDRLREKKVLDALEDLVVFLQGVRDERKAILTVSEGWLLYSPSDELKKVKEDPSQVLQLDPFGRGQRRADGSAGIGNNMAECQVDRLLLADLNDSFRMRQITDDANRSNVTFYPVYARGLAVFDSDIGPNPPPPPLQDAANLRARQQALRAMAQDTDGTSIINTNDIEGAMGRIVDDLSSYYLLGYESTNNKLDGKYRSISVRVKRPGVQVRARKGYRSLTADEVIARTDSTAPKPGSIGNAVAPPAAVVNPRAPFRLRSTAWTTVAGGATTVSVWLVGELDFSTRKDLAWSNGATADISVVSAAGDRVVSQQVPFATSDGAFTVRLANNAPLAAGDYAVRVRLTPQTGQAIPLTDLARITIPADPAPLGESLMLRRGPSTGPRYMATADPRFQRTDRLRLEIPTRSDDASTARLLDRTGKPMQVAVATSDRQDDAGGFRWVVVDATLAPLAPGDYAIEVVVGDAKQVTPFKMVP
jgi:VWFA-related protein